MMINKNFIIIINNLYNSKSINNDNRKMIIIIFNTFMNYLLFIHLLFRGFSPHFWEHDLAPRIGKFLLLFW